MASRSFSQAARKYTNGSADWSQRKADREATRVLREATHGRIEEDAFDLLEPEEHYLPTSRGFVD